MSHSLRETQNFSCVSAGFIEHTPVADGGLRVHVPARPECTTPHSRFLFPGSASTAGLPRTFGLGFLCSMDIMSIPLNCHLAIHTFISCGLVSMRCRPWAHCFHANGKFLVTGAYPNPLNLLLVLPLDSKPLRHRWWQRRRNLTAIRPSNMPKVVVVTSTKDRP